MTFGGLSFSVLQIEGDGADVAIATKRLEESVAMMRWPFPIGCTPSLPATAYLLPYFAWPWPWRPA